MIILRIVERDLDLFNVSDEFVLAHCVGADLLLGAGIAKQFRTHYPNMVGEISLLNDYTWPQILPYEHNNYKIYNLVTKRYSRGKPTREDLNDSLIMLRTNMKFNNEKFLAIPKLGSGLDRLDWNETRKFIEEIFEDTDISIVICNFT